MTEKDESTTATINDPNIDEGYLRVWEIQQGWTGTRWNITTFFLGISFALFGLSLQNQNSPAAITAQRIVGLAIYWFTYLLFQRYSDWPKFLRNYLEERETTTTTRYKLQVRWKQTVHKGFRKWTSVNKLMVYFGLLYLIAVIVLYWLGI